MIVTDAERRIAYFSMEIGLDAAMPTYSGGLGILAGDTIRSAVELKVPLIAVTLLHKKGYFYQKLASDGWQTEEPVEWMIDDFLEPTDKTATVSIEGRDVQVKAWKYEVANMDHSFMQGVECVNHILLDEPEVTVNHPEIINGK